MKICVFDTETTSLEKPYCYNVGYLILDTESRACLVKREFVIEQIWHNLPLFNTAYYANKRSIYVSAMRARTIRMEKFGYVTQQMLRDFRNYEVERAFAYNSAFDEKVFNFNCDWFKVINPFETVPISDIRGFVHHFMIDDTFRAWCEENNAFTESGHYSTTAEALTRYIRSDTSFTEDHTALSDSEIEAEILFTCLDRGADLNRDYQAKRSIERKVAREFTIDLPGEKIIVEGTRATYYKTKNKFVVR
nr:MAG TPA: Oligoribonuclease [Caudoviricetes sp.]